MSLIEITFNNLTLTNSQNREILKNLCGKFRPGEIAGIIGPSFSGKSSLLNSMSGRLSNNLKLEGEILVNGRQRNPEEWSLITGIVAQTFYTYEFQTVYETFEFAATIKYSLHLDIDELVKNTIFVLDLLGFEDKRICELNDIEKIKVSIGVELINNPFVWFLDEPTSKLDPTSALVVLNILRTEANMKKTIVISIHQPTEPMLKYLDKIILLSNGHIVFDGTIPECIEFYKSVGFNLHGNVLPTDFFIEKIKLNNSTPELLNLSTNNFNRLKNTWLSEDRRTYPSLDRPIIIRERISFFTSFWCLVRRELQNFFRNLPAIKAQMIEKVFIILIFGLTFIHVDFRKPELPALNTVIAFIVSKETFNNSSVNLSAFALCENTIKRERRTGCYNGYVAYWAKIVASSAYYVFFELIYIISVYYIIGFNPNFAIYLLFTCIILCEVIFAVSFGISFGIISPNMKSAQILGYGFYLFFVIYSGAFFPPTRIPDWLRWLVWISPIYYAFNAAIKTQLLNVQNSQLLDEEELKNQGLNTLPIGVNLVFLIAYALLSQIVGAVFMEKRVRLNLRINSIGE